MTKKSRTPSKPNVAAVTSTTNKPRKPRATSTIVKNVVVTPEKVTKRPKKYYIFCPVLTKATIYADYEEMRTDNNDIAKGNEHNKKFTIYTAATKKIATEKANAHNVLVKMKIEQQSDVVPFGETSDSVKLDATIKNKETNVNTKIKQQSDVVLFGESSDSIKFDAIVKNEKTSANAKHKQQSDVVLFGGSSDPMKIATGIDDDNKHKKTDVSKISDDLPIDKTSDIDDSCVRVDMLHSARESLKHEQDDFFARKPDEMKQEQDDFFAKKPSAKMFQGKQDNQQQTAAMHQKEALQSLLDNIIKERKAEYQMKIEYWVVGSSYIIASIDLTQQDRHYWAINLNPLKLILTKGFLDINPTIKSLKLDSFLTCQLHQVRVIPYGHDDAEVTVNKQGTKYAVQRMALVFRTNTNFVSHRDFVENYAKKLLQFLQHPDFRELYITAYQGWTSSPLLLPRLRNPSFELWTNIHDFHIDITQRQHMDHTFMDSFIAEHLTTLSNMPPSTWPLSVRELAYRNKTLPFGVNNYTT